MHTREDSPPTLPSPVSRRRSDTERLEAQLAEWAAIIAQCRASAHRATAGTRIEFDRIADELQLLRNEAGAQVMLLKGSMDLDWEDSVSALERSWRAVRTAFQKAEAKF
jgi:hypothetical protein